VGAEDERRARRHVGEVLDEDRALALEVVDDVGVVDDLVADVDRRAELVQRALDDLDRAIDAAQKPRGSARTTSSSTTGRRST
jgi:hypothetical protein